MLMEDVNANEREKAKEVQEGKGVCRKRKGGRSK